MAQVWADVVTVANYTSHSPTLLVGALALSASLITTLIVSEVKNR